MPNTLITTVEAICDAIPPGELLRHDLDEWKAATLPSLLIDGHSETEEHWRAVGRILHARMPAWDEPLNEWQEKVQIIWYGECADVGEGGWP